MSNWHGGKGSKRRNPNEEIYRENYDKIFGKKIDIKVRKETPDTERLKSTKTKPNTIEKTLKSLRRN